MAYTHVSRLTTTSDQVFETVEDFIEFHGSIGELNPLVADFQSELEEGGRSIIRTMVYNHIDDRESHKLQHGFDGADEDDFTPPGKQYTASFISISE